jgi:hypothetical protein
MFGNRFPHLYYDLMLVKMALLEELETLEKMQFLFI